MNLLCIYKKMQLINNHKFHILLLVIKEKQKKEPIMNVKMTLLSLFLLNLFFFILAFSIRWVWSFTKICKAVKMCYHSDVIWISINKWIFSETIQFVFYYYIIGKNLMNIWSPLLAESLSLYKNYHHQER